MKRTASARKSSIATGTATRSHDPIATGRRFAVCVRNDGDESLWASLKCDQLLVVLDENGNAVKRAAKAAGLPLRVEPVGNGERVRITLDDRSQRGPAPIQSLDA